MTVKLSEWPVIPAGLRPRVELTRIDDKATTAESKDKVEIEFRAASNVTPA
jgi:hypothetical protein